MQIPGTAHFNGSPKGKNAIGKKYNVELKKGTYDEGEDTTADECNCLDRVNTAKLVVGAILATCRSALKNPLHLEREKNGDNDGDEQKGEGRGS